MYTIYRYYEPQNNLLSVMGVDCGHCGCSHSDIRSCSTYNEIKLVHKMHFLKKTHEKYAFIFPYVIWIQEIVMGTKKK